jgi:hypothetical protein
LSEATSSFLARGVGLLETSLKATLHFFFCGEGGASAIFSAKERSFTMRWGWMRDFFFCGGRGASVILSAKAIPDDALGLVVVLVSIIKV